MGVEGRDRVDQRDADLDRGALALAGDRHEAREALHDGVVSRPLTVGPGRSEPGDRAVDQPRVDAPQGLPAEPEVVHRPGLEVLDQDVAPTHEIQDQRLPPGMLEIDRDASLPPVDREEVGGLAVGRAGRGPLPAVVAALRVLDLDHLGAVVPEDLGRERSRHDAGEVDDPKVFERPGHASSSRLAMPLYPALGVSSTRGAAPRRPLLTGARDLGRAGPVRRPASGALARRPAAVATTTAAARRRRVYSTRKIDAPRFRPPHAGPPVARGLQRRVDRPDAARPARSRRARSMAAGPTRSCSSTSPGSSRRSPCSPWRAGRRSRSSRVSARSSRRPRTTSGCARWFSGSTAPEARSPRRTSCTTRSCGSRRAARCPWWRPSSTSAPRAATTWRSRPTGSSSIRRR